MSYETTPEGKRQSEALRGFEKRSGRERKLIVAELPVGHDQYRRYLRGETPFPPEYVPSFANAWRVPRREITLALGLDVRMMEVLGLADEPAWDFRAALRPQLTEAQIEQKWQQHKDEPIKDQMAAVEGYLRMAERIRTESTNPPAEQPTRTRRRRRPASERTARGA